MGDINKAILTVVAFFAIIFGSIWLVQGNNFFMYRFFAPREEQVRHDTFKQSQAYNDGMANDLAQKQLAYAQTSDTNAKLIILSNLYHEFASYDLTKLPPESQLFLSNVRSYELHQTTRLP